MKILKSVLSISFLSFLLAGAVNGQKINDEYRLYIKKATSDIQIDGMIDEQAWADAEIATDFFMITPMDTSYAELQTDVRMTYDDDHLYVLVEYFRTEPGSKNVV